VGVGALGAPVREMRRFARGTRPFRENQTLVCSVLATMGTIPLLRRTSSVALSRAACALPGSSNTPITLFA